MSNRLFQGLVHQMRDTIDATVGVVDDSATIIACSDLFWICSNSRRKSLWFGIWQHCHLELMQQLLPMIRLKWPSMQRNWQRCSTSSMMLARVSTQNRNSSRQDCCSVRLPSRLCGIHCGFWKSIVRKRCKSNFPEESLANNSFFASSFVIVSWKI